MHIKIIQNINNKYTMHINYVMFILYNLYMHYGHKFESRSTKGGRCFSCRSDHFTCSFHLTLPDPEREEVRDGVGSSVARRSRRHSGVIAGRTP